jgi:hypothetical protein
MTQADRREGRLKVVESKTKRSLWEHPTLAEELTDHSPANISLLTTSQGKAFDAGYFGAWFANAIEAAGLPNECVLHGLWKSGCVMLAEAGRTTERIKAIRPCQRRDCRALREGSCAAAAGGLRNGQVRNEDRSDEWLT